MSKYLNFRLFRYQIIPNSTSHNYHLFDSVDELILSKNSMFMEALSQFNGFETYHVETTYRSLLHEGDWHVGQVGFKRKARLTNKDFKRKHEDNFPSVFFIINNDPDKQLLVVQEVSGLISPFSFAKKLAKYLNEKLKQQPIEVQIESISRSTEFWSEIEKAKGKIESVEFRIDTPNMARISKVLPEKLRELSKLTNSKSSILKLEGGKDRSLVISEDNEDINGLNSYVSDGGGDYKIKLIGVRSEITKKDFIKKTSIEEIIIENPTSFGLEFALREVLDGE